MLTCVNLDLFVKLDRDRRTNRNGMLALRAKKGATGEWLCGYAHSAVLLGRGRP